MTAGAEGTAVVGAVTPRTERQSAVVGNQIEVKSKDNDMRTRALKTIQRIATGVRTPGDARVGLMQVADYTHVLMVEDRARKSPGDARVENAAKNARTKYEKRIAAIRRDGTPEQKAATYDITIALEQQKVSVVTAEYAQAQALVTAIQTELSKPISAARKAELTNRLQTAQAESAQKKQSLDVLMQQQTTTLDQLTTDREKAVGADYPNTLQTLATTLGIQVEPTANHGDMLNAITEAIPNLSLKSLKGKLGQNELNLLSDCQKMMKGEPIGLEAVLKKAKTVSILSGIIGALLVYLSYMKSRQPVGNAGTA